MSLAEPVWADAIAAIRAAPEIALACHVRPDGDALGSMMALHLALRHSGRATTASWSGDPFVVPRHYSFLPGQETLTEPAQFPMNASLLITFDTGSIDRLATLGPSVVGAEHTIVIDHHRSNTRYGDIHLIDPDAAGSVVIVAELIDRLGLPLDVDVAACLYTGLTTDTGSFRHASATADIHRLAARLIDTGIRSDLINAAIWDTSRLAYLRLLGVMLERVVLEPDHGLVWTWVTNDDFTSFGVELEEIEGVIDIVRGTAEAQVAVVVKQDVDGRYAVSMRSKDDLDVGAVAVECGGGGHRHAGGFTSDEDLDGVMAQVRKALSAVNH